MVALVMVLEAIQIGSIVIPVILMLIPIGLLVVMVILGTTQLLTIEI